MAKRNSQSEADNGGRASVDLSLLEAALGHSFSSPEYAIAALTHSSMRTTPEGRREAPESYERLEFVGDRVLGLVVSEMLYSRFPDEREGDLAKRHTELVRRETLAEVAVKLDIGTMIRMSKGELDGGGQQKESLLADVVEAVIAALYLDAGLEPVKAFIDAHWSPLLEAAKRPPRDPKTALQEWLQQRSKPVPQYELVNTGGEAHSRLFTVSCKIDQVDKTISATASSRRKAEQLVAEQLLSELEQEL